jgi:hypothetical protein
MPNAFLNKVHAERQVLTLVNRHYSDDRQLAGLSALALEQWRIRASLPKGHSLVQALIQLGKLTQTLSNRSNESFVPLDPEVEPKLRRLMDDLASEVSLLSGEG